MYRATRTVSSALAITSLTLCTLAVPGALGTGIASATPAGDNIVINEVYGGGGNSGATLTHDFIELYNPTDQAISLDGWAVHYVSAKGSSASKSAPLEGSIAPKGYFLIEAAKGNGGSVRFASDAQLGELALGGSAGAVVLTKDAASWQQGQTAVDIVGYGGAATAEGTATGKLSASTSASRDEEGKDSDNNAADFSIGQPTPQYSGGDALTGDLPSTGPGDENEHAPGDPGAVTAIEDIQGTGETSPLVNQRVKTAGWVTASYPTGGLNGFVIQMGGGSENARRTGEASRTVFVYTGQGTPSAIDKCVVVTGQVAEFKTSTQISADTVAESLDAAEDCGEKPQPITEDIPTDPAQREANEHMLFQPTRKYTVTNNYDLTSYGSVDLVAGNEPLYQATQIHAPGPAAQAYEAENERKLITLDDAATRNYFTNAQAKNVPLPYLKTAEGIKSLRTGDHVSFQNPVVLSHNFGKWGMRPTSEVTGDSARAELPIAWEDSRKAEEGGPDAVGGDLSIASFNVLNYFTDLGEDQENCSFYGDRNNEPITANRCDVRGAYSQQAFRDQQAKIVKAINQLGVSVLGLEEIENSAQFGQDRDASLKQLVDALNAAGGNWEFVPSPQDVPASEDVIRTAFIYNPDKVAPVGESRILDHDAFTGIARQPLAQEFRTTEQEDADSFVAVVNHYKSKGSVARGDADTGDGQGNNATLRKNMSTELSTWLDAQEDWRGKAQFVMGDFNAYAKEDAIRALEDAGFVNLDTKYDAGLSYQFGGRLGSLDHVLANSQALDLVTGADVWDINSDEPAAFEYSRRNYNVVDFFAEDVFRASDHDPVKVGFNAPGSAGQPEQPGGDNSGGDKPGSSEEGHGDHPATPEQNSVKKFFGWLLAGFTTFSALFGVLGAIGLHLGWIKPPKLW